MLGEAPRAVLCRCLPDGVIYVCVHVALCAIVIVSKHSDKNALCAIVMFACTTDGLPEPLMFSHHFASNLHTFIPLVSSVDLSLHCSHSYRHALSFIMNEVLS